MKNALTMKYDLWIESATPPFTFSLLPLVAKKPVFSWVNMLSSYDMQRKYFLNFRIIEKTLAQLYRYFIVPTGWVRKEIISMNKRAVITDIPYGYYHHHVSLGRNKIMRGKYVLFLGRIEVNQKGLDLLLEAVSRMKNKMNVVIAGSGAPEEEQLLRDLVKRFGLEKRVKLIGKVSGRQKAMLLNFAAATIISSRFETFSLVALESISYLKPVICFDIPQLAWIPKSYAYKVKPFDIDQLARAIDSLAILKVTKLPKQITEPFLQQFNWDTIARKMERTMFNTVNV